MVWSRGGEATPVLPGQQLAEILAPSLGGDPSRLVGKRRVGQQRCLRDLADLPVGVIAALHRPVAPRHQRTPSDEPLGGALGRSAIHALYGGCQPPREPERLPLRSEPLPEPVRQPLVRRLRRDRKQVPAATQRPPVQPLARRVPHRLGHVPWVQPLLEHLRSRLGPCPRIGVLAGGELSRVDAGLGHPALQIVEVREFGLDRAARGPPAAVLDRFGECVQITVVVGERDHTEPQIPIAPHRLVPR